MSDALITHFKDKLQAHLEHKLNLAGLYAEFLQSASERAELQWNYACNCPELCFCGICSTSVQHLFKCLIPVSRGLCVKQIL